MLNFCSECSNLDTKKAIEGKVSGCMYYCKKLKTYVNPSECCCEQFKKTYERSREEQEMIYKEGKNWDDINVSVEFLMVVFVVMLVLGLFMGVFNIS